MKTQEIQRWLSVNQEQPLPSNHCCLDPELTSPPRTVRAKSLLFISLPPQTMVVCKAAQIGQDHILFLSSECRIASLSVISPSLEDFAVTITMNPLSRSEVGDQVGDWGLEDFTWSCKRDIGQNLLANRMAGTYPRQQRQLAGYWHRCQGTPEGLFEGDFHLIILKWAPWVEISIAKETYGTWSCM